jgi:uncharacterized NAD-dependent epimerase/dehydratase family protein
MELLASIDWLLAKGLSEPVVSSIQSGLRRWPSTEKEAAERKVRLFDERNIGIALERLMHPPKIEAV